MTWQQARHAFVDLDGFLESQDPFYVPDRTRQTLLFSYTAISAAGIPFALILVPLTALNTAILLGFGLGAALTFFQGLKATDYRRARMRRVAELRAGAAAQIDAD